MELIAACVCCMLLQPENNSTRECSWVLGISTVKGLIINVLKWAAANCVIVIYHKTKKWFYSPSARYSLIPLVMALSRLYNCQDAWRYFGHNLEFIWILIICNRLGVLETWALVSRPIFTILGVGLDLEPRSLRTLESRSWSWDLGPWILGLRHSWSVKLRQNSWVEVAQSDTFKVLHPLL